MTLSVQNHTILVVDDEASVRESLKKVLERDNHLVLLAENGKEAEDILGNQSVDLVITDLRMPEMTGLELLKRTKKKHPNLEIVLITGHGTIERAVEAMKEGAYDFMTKPFKRADILRIVEKALEKKSLTEENRMLRDQLTDVQRQRTTFIGNNVKVQAVLRMVDRVAATTSNVLITGESGTGKEIIARMIHIKSERARKRFVAVNCGAIPENLVESELFGHVRGAFTGAHRDKEGLFKVASGGSLFLDEISTIPLNLQVKLLRVIEEKEMMPVGSTRTIPIDARIIAASNRNLLEEVESGRFREDLFYRLNVVGVDIPPLRDRKDDIPLLTDHFVKRFNVELNKAVRGASEEVLQIFHSYSWKGNVRELENVIERAMILCDGEFIRPEHLPQVFKSVPSSPRLKTGLKEAVLEFERNQIRDTIQAVDGDKKAAANVLGLSLSSLYRKMAELGLDTADKS